MYQKVIITTKTDILFQNKTNQSQSFFSHFKTLPGNGSGDPYDRYIVGEGLYNVTLKNDSTIIYYGLDVDEPGVYRIQSWAEEGIDTFVGDYGANDNYVPTSPIKKDDNSGEGDNFSIDVEIKKSNFTTYEIDGVTYTELGSRWTLGFSVKSAPSFPVTFPVVFMRVKDSYEEPLPQITSVKVTEDLKQFPDLDGSLKSCMMDGTINPVFNEEDRFYHANSKDGAIIVAKISKPCEYIDKSFSTIQDAGNSSLTLNNKYDYTDFIAQYAEVCNSDGVYGVTEELMLFLHRYQSTHRYFGAGGWVSGQIDYTASEEFYWLFACYTYEA